MNLQHGLWAEAVAVATKVENILVSGNKPVPAYNCFFGKETPYMKHLCTFDECSVVHDGKKIQSKLKNHGEKCIFVGYAENHTGNVYRMFNLQTHHVWTMCDVKWIKCTTEKDKIDGIKPETTVLIDLDVEKVPIVETVLENDDADENDLINHGRPVDADNKVDDSDPSTTLTEEIDDIDPCMLRKMKKLGQWFYPSAEQYVA